VAARLCEPCPAAPTWVVSSANGGTALREERLACGPGYLKVRYDKKQVKGAPSIGTDGELPAGDEEAIFKHYGLTYEPGAGGERRLARR